MSDDNKESLREENEMKEEEAAKEEQKDEEEESSDDEELIGEFDKPVIVEGKRERKSISRLSLGSEQPVQKEEVDFSKGKGVKLADIERVKYEIDRINADKLKPLHRIIFNRGGKQYEIKKNIRSFCGLPYEKDDKAYSSAEARVDKFTMEYCKVLCSLFALPTAGTSAERKERILEFLMKPYDAGKGLPISKGRKSKKKGTPKKRKTTPKKRASKATKKDSSKSEDDSPIEDDSSDDGGDSDKDDKEESSPQKEEMADKAELSESSESSPVPDEKPPKKKKEKEKKEKESKSPKKDVSKKAKGKASTKDSAKKDKKSTGKTKSKVKKVTPVKIERKNKSGSKKKGDVSPVKTPKKETKRKKKEEDDSDSDDEPIAKKLKATVPTNNEIAKIVKQILDGADLETITMKTVCKQVYDKYPDLDLTDKKSFIKETVKKIIS